MSHDTLVHRLVRPVVRAIAPTRITPNHLTTARLITGLAAALGFAQGGWVWPDLAAGVMLVSLLLDRADGELARQTGRTSRKGYRYDLICDCVATAAGFIGLGVGVREVFGPVAILLGIIAALSVTAPVLADQHRQARGRAGLCRWAGAGGGRSGRRADRGPLAGLVRLGALGRAAGRPGHAPGGAGSGGDGLAARGAAQEYAVASSLTAWVDAPTRACTASSRRAMSLASTAPMQPMRKLSARVSLPG